MKCGRGKSVRLAGTIEALAIGALAAPLHIKLCASKRDRREQQNRRGTDTKLSELRASHHRALRPALRAQTRSGSEKLRFWRRSAPLLQSFEIEIVRVQYIREALAYLGKIVFDTTKLDGRSHIIPDRVATSWIAVAWLPDGAHIHERFSACQLKSHSEFRRPLPLLCAGRHTRNVRVCAKAESVETREDFECPLNRRRFKIVGENIFMEWIARRAVHEQCARVHLLRFQTLEPPPTRSSFGSAIPTWLQIQPLPCEYILGNLVHSRCVKFLNEKRNFVIACQRPRAAFPNKINARTWNGQEANHVSETQNLIDLACLTIPKHRLERDTIPVDICNQRAAHSPSTISAFIHFASHASPLFPGNTALFDNINFAHFRSSEPMHSVPSCISESGDVILRFSSRWLVCYSVSRDVVRMSQVVFSKQFRGCSSMVER